MDHYAPVRSSRRSPHVPTDGLRRPTNSDVSNQMDTLYDELAEPTQDEPLISGSLDRIQCHCTAREGSQKLLVHRKELDIQFLG